VIGPHRANSRRYHIGQTAPQVRRLRPRARPDLLYYRLSSIVDQTLLCGSRRHCQLTRVLCRLIWPSPHAQATASSPVAARARHCRNWVSPPDTVFGSSPIPPNAGRSPPFGCPWREPAGPVWIGPEGPSPIARAEHACRPLSIIRGPASALKASCSCWAPPSGDRWGDKQTGLVGHAAHPVS